MSGRDFSVEQLQTFLREAPLQGVLNPAVAKSRAHALEQVLHEINEAERADIRLIDVDVLCRRLHKIHDSSVRPEVVDLYNKRLKATLTDYLAWQADAKSFTSVGGDQTKRLKRREDGAREVSPEVRALEETSLRTSEWAPDIISIPLRADCTVFIQNLPLNLSAAEAGKIARIVEAFASQAIVVPDAG